MALLAMPAAASAQDSREQAIAQAQAEKAKQLRPYTPNQAERLINWAEENLILQPEGFYPLFESVYSGGGFTVGAGYRRFIGDNEVSL